MTDFGAVVVGVDTSEEASHAVSVGWTLSRAADTCCHLVHATRRPVDIPASISAGVDIDALEQRMTAAASDSLRDALRDGTPGRAIEHLEVHVGHPIAALRRAIKVHGAGLVVLGGKHHSRVARWFGGSTAHHAVRALDVPVLITAGAATRFSRVLAAIDLSAATRPTVELASQVAELFGAALRVLHVVEPFPQALEAVPAGLEPDVREHAADRGVARLLKDIAGDRALPHAVRYGHPAEAIAAEAATWPADLIVVGSHGRGWIDRIVIGSTTEHLLNQLPASMLVVPVSRTLATNGRPEHSHA